MTQQTMFLKNTETFAESLARCGVKFHFAYPITPATDVMKRMAVILRQYGGKMLQIVLPQGPMCGVVGKTVKKVLQRNTKVVTDARCGAIRFQTAALTALAGKAARLHTDMPKLAACGSDSGHIFYGFSGFSKP